MNPLSIQHAYRDFPTGRGTLGILPFILDEDVKLYLLNPYYILKFESWDEFSI